MHAYLIVANDQNLVEDEIEKIIKKNKLARLDYSTSKIDEVRQLSSFLKLKLNKPTAVVLQDIQNSTEEALNAFLKNLEEPQANVHFILTTDSTQRILPTILSRCQIIHTRKKTQPDDRQIAPFFSEESKKRFEMIENIRARQDAVSFLKSCLNYLHIRLTTQKGDLKDLTDNISVVQKSLTYIEANGNVNLQLSNMLISLV